MIIRKMTAIRVMTRRTIITDPIIMAEITTAIQIQDQRIMVNGTANGGNGTSNAVKAAKTGDTANVAGMAMLCLAAGLVAVMARRKRTN